MISCSFLLIGSGFSLAGGLGHVPNTDIMQFIASTTFGSLLQQLPNQVRIYFIYLKKYLNLMQP